MKTLSSSLERGVGKRLFLFLGFVLATNSAALAQVNTNPPPQPVVTIKAADAYATEPCTATSLIDRGVFVISRTSYTNLDLKVQVALGGTATNGVDYTRIPNEIVIPKGRWAVEIPVTALADTLPEGIETVVMRIMPIACIAIYPPPPECYLVGSASQAVVHIADCGLQRPAVVTIRAADPYATEPCASATSAILDPGVFVISRSAHTNISMPVNVAISGIASNGVDYVYLTNRWVIPAGKWAIEIPVRAIKDDLMEGPENVVMRILPPFCPQTVVPLPLECYQVGQPAEAVVYIRECMTAPMVRITRPVSGQVFEAPATIPIRAETVDRDGYCWKAEFYNGSTKIGERSVAFFVAPTNGTMVPFEFTWKEVPAGNYVLSVRATDSQGNIGVSDPVRISVGPLPPPTNKPPIVSIVATDPIAIEGTNCWSWWNQTNRYPVATAQEPTYSAALGCPIWWYTNCGPKNATFAIRRSGATNDDLRVFYMVRGTATNGIDYDFLPGSVVIPAGARKAEMLVVPIEDNMIEPVETVVIGLVLPPYLSPLPAPYMIGTPARAGAVIVDSSNPRLATGTLPDRCFYLGGSAIDGSWYRVERSVDMVNWEIVCTNQVIQGEVHFVDPDAVDSSKQFYRAVPTSEPVE